MQGIHHIPAAQYHADPCPSPSLSNSLIKTLLGKSPAHAWISHPKLNPAFKPFESERFDLGTAAHGMLLEGTDSVIVVDADDWRTKEAKAQRESARLQGLTPLLTHQFYDAKAMVEEAQDFIAGSCLAGAFAKGKPEQTIIWEDSGSWCRGMIDWLADDRSLIVDYKTTSASCPDDFMRSSMVAFGYDTQDTFYRRGLRFLGHRPEFLFLVQEDTAPYACYIVEASESMREMAHSKVNRAIAMWTECLLTDHWPAYGNRRYMAQAPVWAMTKEMMYEHE